LTTIKVQISRMGAVTLPAKIRSRYKLGWRDVLTMIDLDGAFLLCPKRSIVPELASEIEKQREEVGLTLDKLFGN